MVRYMQNKRGWVKIVEAFVSIMLIAVVLLIIFNKGYIGGEDISIEVYESQLAILKEISIEDNLRSQILIVPEENLPISWENFEAQGLLEVKNKIISRAPEYLTCQAKLCKLDEICELDFFLEEDVYAQPRAIVADEEVFSPRQLKLFCWVE